MKYGDTNRGNMDSGNGFLPEENVKELDHPWSG